MYNYSNPFIPNSPEGMHTLQMHVQHIHKNIFLSLTPEQLLHIGWSRCCSSCPNLFLTATNQLTLHQNQCPTYIATTNTSTTDTTAGDTTNPTQAQVHDFSNDPTWAIAFNICPLDKYTDLNTIINNNDDFADPSTVLPHLLMTVSQWNLDHKNRNNTSANNTAATNVNHV